MIKKLILLLSLTLLLLPATTGNAEHVYNDENGYHYYFDSSSGFYIRLDNPRTNNISTNMIDELTFTVLWYNKDNSKPNFGYNGIAYGVFDLDTTVSHSRITKKSYEHVYTIHNIDTKLTKTQTGYKIPIEIKNRDSKDSSYSNFKGESGKIDIELNYYHVDHSQAKFYTDFIGGKDIKMFGDKLILRFPVGTYISDNVKAESSSFKHILLDQRFVVNVREKPQPSDDYVFLSQQFIIDDSNGSLIAKPSTWGDITLAYEGVVPKAMEGYNLAVLKNNYGKWVPIGGIVNSQNKTVTAVFDDFGTYAIGLVYKDYGLKNHWAKKEVLGLAYKGVIQPEISTKDKELLTSLDKPIDRFNFTVLLSKALGFQPLDYTGVFSDIKEIDYGQDELGYLMAGVMNGLVFGKESNIPGYMVMEPKNTLTREEAVAFLARAISLNGAEQTASKSKFTKKKKSTKDASEDPKVELKKTYKDANKISDWAAPAVLQATNEKLITPTSGNFNPKGKLTQAEAMSMIYKLMESKKLK
ncbi:putative S-layer protein [Schinkia azotoformans MEV2011]|uniref:Putative S-layer protein n=1 Tax=Schinkia azotoformans MEV2011 TaxID=1348973 RepID=A0A072NQS8_SCHAZ|nr:S-layer homology domain-containing protein [Schinkia azotoformans]KEF40029.1 putative S-layer protein [Schinkia azotoformans MEV2011]MEC1694725.1 S-layer homology domain-containing protein [Schinkia azotoformans]MEC1726408.1 S-layer homology domain-containing protein [Schinkia azotoformans]MEC1756952.1 S-layer homology domain-containing protein [Schinkia azotoformans]MEC1771018.1 S-layer homology domain-containing protein [Schinkia azotoformans]